MEIKEILTKAELKAEVLRHPKVLVKFFTETCMPCKKMSKLIGESDIEIPVVKINASENIDLAREFSISAVPVLVYFKDGEPINTIHGVVSIEKIKDIIK